MRVGSVNFSRRGRRVEGGGELPDEKSPVCDRKTCEPSEGETRSDRQTDGPRDKCFSGDTKWPLSRLDRSHRANEPDCLGSYGPFFSHMTPQ